ncbi:alkyl hydroperoxide reductase subunit F [Porphyromonas sp. COT-239 OH1446]|uniref:alkyl hydroperoxide reductase subunit F n=1 Tax=Porphyromonas sp. COT-239 OH1446 TaxID=1515613 RepID=UPI00052E42F5|nr:alkyl hydroperoxide reductase subunit F [Porphyromonas sp. COT-239 OH1446]KGN68408.1 NADH dehydrogenase [Porphyromonas sp. COT-239 OH1446]
MKLEQAMIDQLRSIFSALEHHYTLKITQSEDANGQAMVEMITDFASSSDKLSVEVNPGTELRLELLRDGEATGVSFRGIPTGHEFTSLILAVFNADGKGKNLPDEVLVRRIQSLKKPFQLTTYASLSCTNCPEVVQALNLVALIAGEGAQHEMVDGAIYKEEVERLDISAVPTVYLGDQVLHIGQSNLGELVLKLEAAVGKEETESQEPIRKSYDLIVIGAGPAGTASAIYSARKGLHVALVAERVGGQVNDTTAIENIPSVASTTGTQLAADLRAHAHEYNIDILEQRRIEGIELAGTKKEVKTSMGEVLEAEQIIIATGAAWRKLGVPGEAEHIGRGVAFCPHCDGPFFKGKDIAVVGGGNSGIEAAIDLAGICKSVTVLEFAETLKADTVLQEKLMSLPNVTVHTSVATQEVVGDGTKISSLKVAPRDGKPAFDLPVAGVFVQIGLAANTQFVDGLVERNRIGEIVIDERCRTSVEGIYAAGDCTTVPYKQIVIAMGEGAKAALTAFDERIRGGQH